MTAELARGLGQAAALGFEPGRILRADPVERPILTAAVEHAARFVRERDEALARAIVAEYAAAVKRGTRKG